ncbi:reverse transcriptase domain-containing protein [Tanacetum coccineum]
MTVVTNDENELVPTRLVTGWRVCIDYSKLNEATRKDHFPLPFMDQMLERLVGNEYYCFLDGFSGYFQIPIDPKDQEKTTFTCPYGTFAYRRMPFSLCNAPGTFQRCMMAIFHDMIEKMMEVFIDDFSVFRNSFSTCLQDLRFDISFADALLLMPRFAPTIKSLLMNKEKLLELAKIPLNENCSAMLLKKLFEKLGDPDKFLIPGMDIDALIDVYEGELVLRDENEQITFHISGTPKHPQKFENESIKMVSDACKDSFKKFTDEPALVCLPPSEDVNNEKEKHEVKNLAEPTVKRQTRITPCLKNFRVVCKESIFHSNKPPQVSLVFAITSTLSSIEPKDSLIMGDEHLSTFSTEEIIPILRESEETSRSDSQNVLPLCDDFSSINVPRDDFNSYDSNLDESTFLITPLSDSNKDECLAPEDDIEFLLHDDPSTPLKSVASILKGFINDLPFEENDDLFDLEYKTNDWKGILYDVPIDEAECFDSGGDNDEIDTFLAIEVPTYIEGYYDSEGDVTYLESLLSDDTTHNLSPEVFFDHKLQQLRNEPENEPLITFSPKSDPLHHEFTCELITIPPGISPENFHTIIESLPSSTTLVEDSDPNREEIDIFSRIDDSIPPGIASDFDSEEDIFDNLLNDDSTHERLTFNIEPNAPMINNVNELNEDECFNQGGGEINVEVDNSFTFVTWIFLPYLTYPEVRICRAKTTGDAFVLKKSEMLRGGQVTVDRFSIDLVAFNGFVQWSGLGSVFKGWVKLMSLVGGFSGLTVLISKSNNDVI